MVQYNLPKSEKRREPEGPQVAGLVSGAAETAPKLAKYLAEWLLKRNVDPREVYKQTGYIQDTTTGELIYSFGDQGMKVRTDNPLLAQPEEPDLSGGSFNKAARVYEKPGIPMKEGDAGYTTRGEPNVARARYGFPGNTKPGEALGWADPSGMDQPPGSLPTSEFGLPSDVKDADQMAFWDLPSDVWGDPVGNDFLQQSNLHAPRRSNVSREPTFEELFTHPLQEQYTPELGGIPINARYTDDAGKYSGRYFGGDNPGDVSKATASAEGQVGGIDVMNSMPSVALHEVGAHGGQNLFGWHRGGSSSENWMEDRGKELRRQAAQAQEDLLNQKVAVIDRLMAEQPGLDRYAAMDMYDELYPGYWDRVEQYRKAEKDAAVSPDYTAYQHEGGEAAGRNFQTRAAELQSNLPMTDENYLWKGSPNLQKRHEGDVHPLETYDVAPDLMRQRVVTKSDVPFTPKEVNASKRFDPKTVDQTTYMAESQPLKSQFDWLLSKAPAPAAAGAVGGAALASGSPASASEGPEGTFSTPKADRLPLAASMSKQDRVPYEGDWVPGKRGTPPTPFPTDEELWGSAIPNALSHARSGIESTLGMGGDLSFDTGMGFKLPLSANVLPSSEDVGKYTDEKVDKLRPDLARTINDYTRNPSQDAGSELLGQGVEQVADPTDWLGGLGLVKNAKHIPDLARLLKGWL